MLNTHLDHVAALPVYVARRRMMKMDPPTIYLPAHAVSGVEAMLRAFSRLDRGRLPCKLIPVNAGDEIELSRELVVTVHGTKHTVPSVGFIVWQRRRSQRHRSHGHRSPQQGDTEPRRGLAGRSEPDEWGSGGDALTPDRGRL